MTLYRIDALYLGKDLDDIVTIEYIARENDEEVFKYLDEAHTYWLESIQSEEDIPGYDDESNEDPTDEQLMKTSMAKRIMKNKGDFKEGYNGEFYDVKYRWEGVGSISSQEIEVLKKFKILE